eukprot:TRINITY_DN2786_c0_g1_i1.p1 TRINITY_DN2786_c0_g1~~TRINITY_DN2786_c0_g1_i1.p1  ORF type:complete len:615 (-),score=136.87 TRINITY_DN2786_c0_g1_i1:21-1829(-)
MSELPQAASANSLNPDDPMNKEWIGQQKKVFFRWIHYVIKAKDPSWAIPAEVKDLLEELKDGVVLARLVKSVSEKDFPQMTDEKQKTPFAVMGRLEKVLTFLKTREGLNITATGNDVFSGNEVQVMGLIWIMILKYQNITRNELLAWLREKLSPLSRDIGPSSDVKNFTDHWSSGMALCGLVASIAPSAINLAECEKMAPLERLTKALSVAEEMLKIPRLLEASDLYPHKPHERIMMTYLSFFRNLHAPKPTPAPQISEDQSKLIAELRAEIARLKLLVDQKEEKIIIIEKTKIVEIEKEVEELKKTHSTEISVYERKEKEAKLEIADRDKLVEDLKEQLAKSKADLQSSERAVIQARREIDRLETTEIEHLKSTIAAQAAEIELLKAKNKSLIGDMKTEVMKLLKKQKEDTDLIEILKTKVASYSGKIVELQQLIQEKGLTNVEALEQELRKMAIKNEELLKKIAQLEKEMHEAQRSAEKLMASIESEDGGGSAVSLKDQLDRALEQIRELMEWRKKALNEMAKLRDEQSELTALLGQMDKLVKTAVKSKSNSADSNKRAWEQLQQLVAWSGSKLDDLQNRVDEFTEAVKKPVLSVEKINS